MTYTKGRLPFFIISIVILSLCTLIPSSSSTPPVTQPFPLFLSPILPPKNLSIGDLIFIESVAFFHNIRASWDHVALYVGDNMFIESNNYAGVPLFFGRKSGVQITPLWKYGLWAQYYTFAKVTCANETQRMAAVAWALDQIGKGGYQVSWGNGSWWANPDPNDTTDPNANNWYCAEFVWAAYYNTSNGTINLDISPGPLLPPLGDGIHFSVNPQAIASHENISIILNEGVPPTPTRPQSDFTNVTIPQVGVYTTTMNTTCQDLEFQWVWGDSFHPETWVSEVISSVVTAKHLWWRVNIHDRRENNFVYDVRVRCKNSRGRISAWSDPLAVDVTPNVVIRQWVSPTSHTDTKGWFYESHAYDGKTVLSRALYTKIGDRGWCDEPLCLRLETPIMINGFRLCAKKSPYHDEMIVSFYNGSTMVNNCTFHVWPNNRWLNIDFERYRYFVDKVEIRFHLNSSNSWLGFFIYPCSVYEFQFSHNEE